jgi:hypothetical protein
VSIPDQTDTHLIVTVHGIRTFGKWQERLENLVLESIQDASVEFCHYKYGYFSVLAFLFPPLRWLVVRRFRNELRALIQQHRRKRVDLVGHSFGTHIIAWALFGLAPEERVFIHTIILSGSVLRPGFNWSRLIGSRVGRVVNDCGLHDNILLLNQIVVLFTGMAGRVGFSGMTSGVFRNRFSPFGHSGYFKDKAGKLYDGYMLERWVPILTTEAPIEQFGELPDGGFWSGLLFWITNNAEPVKLTVYVAPLVVGLIWVWQQRQEAVREAQIASARATVAIDALIADQIEKAAYDPNTQEAIRNHMKEAQMEALAKLGLTDQQIKYRKYLLLLEMMTEDKSPSSMRVRANSDYFWLMRDALDTITKLAKSGDPRFATERDELKARFWTEVCDAPGTSRYPECQDQ